MDINEEDILNYEAISENQINTKKQIINEFINYTNDYNYLKNKDLHKFIFEENGDEYIHANLNSAVYTLHPFSYQKITDEHRDSVKIGPKSLSKEIFEQLLKPIGWKREEKNTHFTFTLNGTTYTHVEVIEIVKQLLIDSPEKAQLIPKSSPFRKVVNPICHPISNKWIHVSGYHEFFKLENIVDEEIKLPLKSSITQFIRKYSQQEYSEITRQYFIKVGNYIEPSPELSIMKNITKDKYEYVDISKIIGRTCVGCKVITNNYDYSSKEVTYCKSCSKTRDSIYRNTLRGKILSMYRDIKNDIRLFSYTPEEPLITFTEFLLQYISQGGICAYSGKPLLIKSHDNKTISRERINNKKGYINGNVIFIFKIFNVSPGQTEGSDWSIEKINKMKELITQEINLSEIIALTTEIKKNKQGNQGEILPEEDQLKRRELGEVEWKKYYHNRYLQQYRKNPKGFILGNIIGHRDYDKKQFGRKGDITLDTILDLLILQKGRCCISNIPLNLIQTGQFTMSIDRIDNTKPHDMNNVRLMCKEFNCWNDLHWTKELFDELFN